MYTKDGQTISGKRIVVDGCVILNPTAEQLAEQGWVEVQPYQPTAEEIARQEREAEIWELKEQLQEGDYKIIKCYEAQLMGEQMPYDYASLIEDRNAMRDRINELENADTREK